MTIQYIFGDMIGSQIYIRGCCARHKPPSEKIFTSEKSI